MKINFVFLAKYQLVVYRIYLAVKFIYFLNIFRNSVAQI